MGIVRTEGVILHTYPFSETSKIVHAYTEDYGSQSLLAKGARRQGSKFGGALETFTRCELVYYRKRVSSLHVLSECAVIDSYPGLAGDLVKFYAGSVVLEMVKRFTMPDEENPTLYHLLTASLAGMASRGRDEAEYFLLTFTWRFLSLLGFRPDFATCASCGRGVAQAALLFSNEKAAGALCETCAGRVPPDHTLPPEAGGLIEAILSARAGGEGALPEGVRAGLWRFTRYYIALHLNEEREIASLTSFLGLAHPSLQRTIRTNSG
jgi:DNA repair protein RecO (recombination protein O)